MPGVVETTYTFVANQVITSTLMNNIIDETTFTSTALANGTLALTAGQMKVATGGITSNELAADAVTANAIANEAVTFEKLNSNVIFVPSGGVMAFAMNGAPTGWLAADGSAVSRSTYATLFAAIATTYGSGDGSTTFNLPDLRGYFVRGSGTNSDSTVSGTFGTKQADAFQGHWHEIWGTPAQGASVGGAEDVQSPNSLLSSTSVRTAVTDGVNGTPRVASETRPRNIPMLYCIKI
jgi:microcystin-dependent protein